MSDDPGHDQDVGDGSHRIEHQHWAIRASEQEGAPGQTNPEPSRSMGHSANNAPSRMQQARDRLSPYAHRLKEDIKGAPRQAVTSAKQTIVDTSKRAVMHADQRLGSAENDFTAGFRHPIKEVQQGRQIRRKQQVYSELQQEHNASPFTPAPRAKKQPAKKYKGTKTFARQEHDSYNGGFLFGNGPSELDALFGPVPIRKGKQTGGPADYLL
jgi:hypothetical protein